jgi:hypothetical protein
MNFKVLFEIKTVNLYKRMKSRLALDPLKLAALYRDRYPEQAHEKPTSYWPSAKNSHCSGTDNQSKNIKISIALA